MSTPRPDSVRLLLAIAAGVWLCSQPAAGAATPNGPETAAAPTLSIALSRDGSTLAVGAPSESGGATGIGGDPSYSPGSVRSGAVYVFVRRGKAWSQQAYVKASNTSAGDAFGISVSLSSDGNTLAVGAYLEDSPGTGINGNQGGIADNNSNAGAVYVFARGRGGWSQQAYVKASNTHANAYFGRAVSLNGDGNTLAVGAVGESTDGLNSGAAYIFTRSANIWSQQARVKACNKTSDKAFGTSVDLSGDGNNLKVGAGTEARDAAGFNANRTADGSRYAGAVHVFSRNTGAWFATGACNKLQQRQ